MNGLGLCAGIGGLELGLQPFGIHPWGDVVEERKPMLHRVADGIPNHVDRTHALGNAVVPEQASLAFATLVTKIVGGRRPDSHFMATPTNIPHHADSDEPPS